MEEQTNAEKSLGCWDREELMSSVIAEGKLSVVHLLDEGFEINSKGKNGFSLLHHAVFTGNTIMISTLRLYNADMNIQDENGHTPLYHAVSMGNLEIIKSLLEGRAEVTESEISLAIAMDNHELAELLRDQQSKALSLEEEKNQEQVEASTKSSDNSLQGYEDDTNYVVEGNAVSTSNSEGITKTSSSPKEMKTTELSSAVIKGDLDQVRFLLDTKPDIKLEIDSKDEDGCTPLHYAASEKDPEIASLLIDRGASVNAQNKKGCTPLYYAVLSANEGIVSLLLDNGADIDIKKDSGFMLLDLATSRNSLPISKLLLRRSAEINTLNKHLEHDLLDLNNNVNIALKLATTTKNAYDLYHNPSQDNLRIFAKNAAVLAAMYQGTAAQCAAAELAGKALLKTINYFEGKYGWSDFVEDLPAASLSVAVIGFSSISPVGATLLHTAYLGYETCYTYGFCPDLNSWIMGDNTTEL